MFLAKHGCVTVAATVTAYFIFLFWFYLPLSLAAPHLLWRRGLKLGLYISRVSLTEVNHFMCWHGSAFFKEGAAYLLGPTAQSGLLWSSMSSSPRDYSLITSAWLRWAWSGGGGRAWITDDKMDRTGLTSYFNTRAANLTVSPRIGTSGVYPFLILFCL